MGFPGGSAGKESTRNARDLGSIPGLENPLEKETATHYRPVFWPGEFHGLVHGVAKSRTQLSDLHFTSLHHPLEKGAFQ